jgi:mevalonate pyrophosphate decarboxylase
MSTGQCAILAQQMASNILLLNNKKKVTQLKHKILKLTMESSHLYDKLLKLIEVDKPMVKLDDNDTSINKWEITEENMTKYHTIVNLSVHHNTH